MIVLADGQVRRAFRQAEISVYPACRRSALVRQYPNDPLDPKSLKVVILWDGEWGPLASSDPHAASGTFTVFGFICTGWSRSLYFTAPVLLITSGYFVEREVVAN